MVTVPKDEDAISLAKIIAGRYRTDRHGGEASQSRRPVVKVRDSRSRNCVLAPRGKGNILFSEQEGSDTFCVVLGLPWQTVRSSTTKHCQPGHGYA